MIEDPYCVYEQTKITKILELFRLMNLRQLPVLSKEDNVLKGIITREDIFKYMTI